MTLRQHVLPRRSAPRRTRRAATTLLPLLGLALLPAPMAQAAPVVQAVSASADTYVSSAYPTTPYGSSTRMNVDDSPVSQSFLRFDLSEFAGRPISEVRLRLYQADSSPAGQRVHLVTSSWSEGSTTYQTKPAISTDVLATFGAVSAGLWYEVTLPLSAVPAGPVELALTTPSSDGARWGTRESTTPPELLVTAEPPPPQADGVRRVAGPDVGSSDPTYYAANHRTVVTAAGRLLSVFGRHGSGVQLTWRDAGGAWQTRSLGASTSGGLLTGTSTGDWTSSIAVSRNVDGTEQAWVVMARTSSSAAKPLYARRLTGLDDAAGPTLGPLVTLDAAPRGAYKADVAVESRGEADRVAVLYSRRTGDTSYELVTAWLADDDQSQTTLTAPTVLAASSSSTRFGSLLRTPTGLAAATRAGSGVLRVYRHAAASGDSPASWIAAPDGPSLTSSASPSGSALPDGTILVAAETDVTNHVSTVFRFPPSGSPSVALRLTGTAQPQVIASGDRAWTLAVRFADGAVVSRELSAGTWSDTDRVELDPATVGGRLAWPNAVREADDKLRLIVEGPGSASTRSSVWSWQRPLVTPPA